ncbi:MAG: hypothetical protein ABR577_09605 [Pyrinomonadaceae bacterium]
MLKKIPTIVILLASSISVLAQTKIHPSPDKSLRAVIIPVGNKGYESEESRVEIRTPYRKVLRWRSFASPDGQHGGGVHHAEWSLDGQFFIFNVFSSGGHQPWHVATYFYIRRNNKFYSLDAFIGPITSDFKLQGRNTVVATRFNFDRNEEKEPVKVRLQNLRAM